MLRIALASALVSVGSCLRMEASQHQQPPRPAKRYYGPEHRSCRVPKARSREEVVGGTVVTDETAFPFLAWLGDNDGTRMSQFCGGSLISDRVVLTAGHCLYEDDAHNANLWVRLRLANFAEADGVAREVINWRRHHDYSATTLHNDLTLLLLNESVPADLVAPLKLSDGTREFEHAGEKVVAGWGSTDENCQVYDTLLRMAAVPMGTDGPSCSTQGSKTVSPSDDYDVNSQCCAGKYTGAMRYPGCGDSGGPLLANDNGDWYQVGMVSWSYGVPYPDVFTRVSYFGDWIGATISELLEAGLHPFLRPKNRTEADDVFDEWGTSAEKQRRA